MTGYCVSDDHKNCPDSKEDSYGCSCACHVEEALAWLLSRTENRRNV